MHEERNVCVCVLSSPSPHLTQRLGEVRKIAKNIFFSHMPGLQCRISGFSRVEVYFGGGLVIVLLEGTSSWGKSDLELVKRCYRLSLIHFTPFLSWERMMLYDLVWVFFCSVW